MDCQRFSLCIMNAKVLVHTGVLNRPAVVPSSLIIPTTAGGAQHYQKTKIKKSPQASISPRSLTFNDVSALHFCLLFLNCWVHIWDLLSNMALLPTLSQYCTGNRNHFKCIFKQISLVASCSAPPHWLSRSLNNLFTQYCFLTIRSHKSKQKHCKISHSWNQLLFFFF